MSRLGIHISVSMISPFSKLFCRCSENNDNNAKKTFIKTFKLKSISHFKQHSTDKKLIRKQKTIKAIFYMSIKFLYRLAKQNCPIIEESPDKGSGIKTFNAFKSNTFDNYASRLLRFDNHFYWFLCQRALFQPTNNSIRRKA